MPVSLSGKIEEAALCVRQAGLSVELVRNPPPSPQAIRRAQSVLPSAIVEAVLSVYYVIGDGLRFRWMDDEDHGPFGMASFASLGAIVDRYVSEQDTSPVWDDDYDFRYTKDPGLARETARRMRGWVEFHQEGNGDGFCLEESDAGVVVVFNKHDWYDGGVGDNGIVVAPSFTSFVSSWASRCFQRPSGLWWPEVLDEDGIDWSDDQFDSRLVL